MMELYWLKLGNWFYENSHAFSICSLLFQHITVFPKAYIGDPSCLHLVSFIGKGPCIRQVSLRDAQRYLWNVERLLNGQNESKAFTVDLHSCQQCNSWNKINSKCREVALLGRLRMMSRSFQNFPCRDFLKTLTLDHLNVETDYS